MWFVREKLPIRWATKLSSKQLVVHFKFNRLLLGSQPDKTSNDILGELVPPCTACLQDFPRGWLL